MHSINKYNVNRREFTFIEVKQKDISVTFMDYGATIISIFVPDKDGKMESVLMAYDSLKSYIGNDLYLNATIGPSSGRIKNGTFTINNELYQLDKNFLEEENLHGGKESLAFKFFEYKVKEEAEQTIVTFKYYKKDKVSKYPGNQIFKVIYTISTGTVAIDFNVTTDQDTLVNLTNHAYFNLSGNLKQDILDHELQIKSSNMMKLDNNFVPNQVVSSINTFADFKDKKRIRENLNEETSKLQTKGIDHPLLLDNIGIEECQITLYDPVSERQMEVYTTYPCVVCYTYNFPNKKNLLYGAENKKHMGICFEAQYEPNGINIHGLNNSILRKNENYEERTVLKFSVKE